MAVASQYAWKFAGSAASDAGVALPALVAGLVDCVVVDVVDCVALVVVDCVGVFVDCVVVCVHEFGDVEAPALAEGAAAVTAVAQKSAPVAT